MRNSLIDLGRIRTSQVQISKGILSKHTENNMNSKLGDSFKKIHFLSNNLLGKSSQRENINILNVDFILKLNDNFDVGKLVIMENHIQNIVEGEVMSIDQNVMSNDCKQIIKKFQQMIKYLFQVQGECYEDNKRLTSIYPNTYRQTEKNEEIISRNKIVINNKKKTMIDLKNKKQILSKILNFKNIKEKEKKLNTRKKASVEFSAETKLPQSQHAHFALESIEILFENKIEKLREDLTSSINQINKQNISQIINKQIELDEKVNEISRASANIVIKSHYPDEIKDKFYLIQSEFNQLLSNLNEKHKSDDSSIKSVKHECNKMYKLIEDMSSINNDQISSLFFQMNSLKDKITQEVKSLKHSAPATIKEKQIISTEVTIDILGYFGSPTKIETVTNANNLNKTIEEEASIAASNLSLIPDSMKLNETIPNENVPLNNENIAKDISLHHDSIPQDSIIESKKIHPLQEYFLKIKQRNEHFKKSKYPDIEYDRLEFIPDKTKDIMPLLDTQLKHIDNKILSRKFSEICSDQDKEQLQTMIKKISSKSMANYTKKTEYKKHMEHIYNLLDIKRHFREEPCLIGLLDAEEEEVTEDEFQIDDFAEKIQKETVRLVQPKPVIKTKYSYSNIPTARFNN